MAEERERLQRISLLFSDSPFPRVIGSGIGAKFILDRKEGRERLQTEAVPFEPFYLPSPLSVCLLLDSSKAGLSNQF